MTEDIVTRLRQYSVAHYPTRYGACMEEAADEIEMLKGQIALLRADRERWKALAIHNDQLAQIQAGIYPPIQHYEQVSNG